jgi:hypothetical protein
MVQFSYNSITGSDDAKDQTYYCVGEGLFPLESVAYDDGGDTDDDGIICSGIYHGDAPDLGYTLDSRIDVAGQGGGTCVAVARKLTKQDGSQYVEGDYLITLLEVNFDNQPQLSLKVTLRWNPPDQSAAQKQFVDAQKEYNRERERLTKEAFVKAARERIKLASNIEPRNSMDLREEERVVIYRKLIGQLLNVGVNLDNAKTRHITAEIVSSVFDIDTMLYFVAPEWWQPRLHESHQTFGSSTLTGTVATNTPITSDYVVSWGGAKEAWRDNYWITEDSKPAKLGSSLGWLIQLDGDNLRNAFLNAPWVKAVIPIRPGKELDALNWLTHASVEGTDGLDAKYQAANNTEAKTIADALKAQFWTAAADKQRYSPAFGPADVTVRDAIKYLAAVVRDKSAKANQVQSSPNGSYLPTDVVYEHGFFPLDGFKAEVEKPFEVFDQWIEVLPTDQIVPVEVKYDPKTGMQI